MNQKTKKTKRTSVEVSTFDPGCFVEFTDTMNHAAPLNRGQSSGNGRKKASPRKSPEKKQPTAVDHDRWRLGELEIFLNNCLNLARGIESKRMTKIIQLLSDTRTQVKQLRG